MLNLEVHHWAFVASLIGYQACYALGSCAISSRNRQSSRPKDEPALVKPKSWILTGLNAFVTSLASLPLALELVTSQRLDVHALRHSAYSDCVLSVFMAYLVSDLVVGSICYPSLITIATGWTHHLAYLALVAYISRQALSSIFALALLEEIPTCLLAAGVIWPSLRHDLIFVSLFGLLRLVLHSTLLLLYATPYGRSSISATAHAGWFNDQWLPVLAMTGALVLHVHWFQCALKGLKARRRRQSAIACAKPLPASPAPAPVVVQSSTHSKSQEESDPPYVNLAAALAGAWRQQSDCVLHTSTQLYYEMRSTGFGSETWKVQRGMAC